MAQRVGRGIALPFQDGSTTKGWGVSSTPRPYFTSGKDPVPIVQEAEWAPGPVWTGGKSRPTGIRSPDRPAHSQSLYRLNYPAHNLQKVSFPDQKIFSRHILGSGLSRVTNSVCSDKKSISPFHKWLLKKIRRPEMLFLSLCLSPKCVSRDLDYEITVRHKFT